MIKQIIALVIFSFAIVFSMAYAEPAIQWLVSGHEWVSQLLTNVFSGGPAGSVIRSLIALLSVPVFVGLLPTFVYWMIRRHWFPYFMEVVWVVWFIQVGALFIVHKAST
jgi:hypothetical protein